MKSTITITAKYTAQVIAHPEFPASGFVGGNTYEAEIELRKFEWPTTTTSKAYATTDKVYIINGKGYGSEFFKEI